MGTDTCLPVARYSHAIGLRPDNSVPWTHIQSSNLFIIIKGTDKGVEDEKLMLRIVHANDVLESLDVSNYVDQAVRTRRSAQNKGEILRLEQLPIFGMTKDATVALRYTLRDGQARRIQMRMHSPAECRQIFNALQSRGMQFTEQRGGTARPGTARPLTMSSHLATPQPSSPYFDADQQPARHPFASHVVEAGSLSQSRLAEHDTSQVDSMHRLGHADSRDMLPPKLFARDETFAPREVAPTRPSTAQIYRSYSIQPPPSQFDAHDIVHQAHKSGLARPSSTSNTTAAEALSQAVEQYRSPPHSAANDVSYPSFDTTHAGGSQLRESSTTMGSPSNDRQGTVRPSTSSSFVFPETLEHEIPPRRELPFQRPDSRQSGSNAGASRPRSALTLPPLPKPRLSPQNSIFSTYEARQKPASPRPQTSSPLKRSFADMSKSASGAERPNTASPSKKLATTRIPSRQAPAKKPSRMEELLQSRKVSLEKSSASKAKRTNSLADAPGEEDDSFLSKESSPSKAPVPRDSMSPVRRADAEQDSTVNAYAAVSGHAQQGDSLAQYAGQSLEDRQAALDEFMVQNLENPDFTKLCRDVENCWRRIALGL